MIPLLTGSVEGEFGTPNKIVYNSTPSITLNDPNESFEDTYLVEDVSITPSWDESIEPLPDRSGATTGTPREAYKLIVIRGWAKGKTFNSVFEKVIALNRAFNPYLAYEDDASTSDTGFLNLDFDVPTSDTATWPGGLIHCRYKVRPIALPVPLVTKWDNLNARFVIQLRAVDPRRYEQTQQVQTNQNALGFGASVSTDNTKATYDSYPTITIDFTGAPTADINIKYNSVTKITIDYTKVGSHTSITIDCKNRTAAWDDGSDATSALKSGSVFFAILHSVNYQVGTTVLPSASTLTVRWNRAFA